MQPLEQIRAIAERVAASRGLEIWDIQSRREASGHVVRVFIDRPGPAATPEESVSIEDCEQVNREIEHDSRRRGPAAVRVHARGFVAGTRSAAARRGGLPAVRRTAAKVVVSEPVDNQKAFEGRLRGVEGRRRAARGAERTDAPAAAAADYARHGLEVEFLETVDVHRSSDYAKPVDADDRGARQGKGHRGRHDHHRDRRRRADGVAQVLQDEREPEDALQSGDRPGRPVRHQAHRRRRRGPDDARFR